MARNPGANYLQYFRRSCYQSLPPLHDRSKSLLSKPGLKVSKGVRHEKHFNRLEDSFHDCLPSSPESISADIVREKQTDNGMQFCASSEDKIFQTETAKCEVGVQVILPLLAAENFKGNNEKTKFYIGIVNFGTLMLLFNSITKVNKLNYWQGFFKREIISDRRRETKTRTPE